METNQDTQIVPTNVLLAEDDPKDRLEVRLHLERMGFIVYDTPTSREAKEIFQHEISAWYSSISQLTLSKVLNSVAGFALAQQFPSSCLQNVEN